MERLSIANQIKIIKDAGLKIPVYRAPTEDYDPECPTKFDRHVMHEAVEVNVSVRFLLGLVEYLSKEILIMNQGKAINPTLWNSLKTVRKLVKEQHNTMGGSRRR